MTNLEPARVFYAVFSPALQGAAKGMLKEVFMFPSRRASLQLPCLHDLRTCSHTTCRCVVFLLVSPTMPQLPPVCGHLWEASMCVWSACCLAQLMPCLCPQPRRLPGRRRPPCACGLCASLLNNPCPASACALNHAGYLEEAPMRMWSEFAKRQNDRFVPVPPDANRRTLPETQGYRLRVLRVQVGPAAGVLPFFQRLVIGACFQGCRATGCTCCKRMWVPGGSCFWFSDLCVCMF